MTKGFYFLFIIILIDCQAKNYQNQNYTINQNVASVPTISRGDLEGFLDIKWGENMENAKRILTAKGYKTGRTYGDYFIAEGEYTGTNAKLIIDFFEGKFYHVAVSLNEKKDEYDFNRYFNLLIEKYWRTNIETDVNASSGKNTFRARWVFDNNCVIKLWFDQNLWIDYTNLTEYQNKINRGREESQRKREMENKAIMNDL